MSSKRGSDEKSGKQKSDGAHQSSKSDRSSRGLSPSLESLLHAEFTRSGFVSGFPPPGSIPGYPWQELPFLLGTSVMPPFPLGPLDMYPPAYLRSLQGAPSSIFPPSMSHLRSPLGGSGILPSHFSALFSNEQLHSEVPVSLVHKPDQGNSVSRSGKRTPSEANLSGRPEDLVMRSKGDGRSHHKRYSPAYELSMPSSERRHSSSNLVSATKSKDDEVIDVLNVSDGDYNSPLSLVTKRHHKVKKEEIKRATPFESTDNQETKSSSKLMSINAEKSLHSVDVACELPHSTASAVMPTTATLPAAAATASSASLPAVVAATSLAAVATLPASTSGTIAATTVITNVALIQNLSSTSELEQSHAGTTAEKDISNESTTETDSHLSKNSSTPNICVDNEQQQGVASNAWPSTIALPPRKRLLRNPEELGGIPPPSQSSGSDSPSSSSNFRSCWKKFSAKVNHNGQPTHRVFSSGGKPMYDCRTFFQKMAAKDVNKSGILIGKQFMTGKSYFHRSVSRNGSRYNRKDSNSQAPDGSTSPRITRSQSKMKQKKSGSSPSEPPAPVRKSMRKKTANSKYDAPDMVTPGSKSKKDLKSPAKAASHDKSSETETTPEKLTDVSVEEVTNETELEKAEKIYSLRGRDGKNKSKSLKGDDNSFDKSEDSKSNDHTDQHPSQGSKPSSNVDCSEKQRTISEELIGHVAGDESKSSIAGDLKRWDVDRKSTSSGLSTCSADAFMDCESAVSLPPKFRTKRKPVAPVCDEKTQEAHTLPPVQIVKVDLCRILPDKGHGMQCPAGCLAKACQREVDNVDSATADTKHPNQALPIPISSVESKTKSSIVKVQEVKPIVPLEEEKKEPETPAVSNLEKSRKSIGGRKSLLYRSTVTGTVDDAGSQNSVDLSVVSEKKKSVVDEDKISAGVDPKKVPSVGERSQSPAVRSHSPAVRSQSPVVRTQSPAIRSHSPAVRLQNSEVDQLPSSVVRSQSPAIRSQSPLVRSISPAVRSQSPAVRSHSSVVRTNDLKITISKAGLLTTNEESVVNTAIISDNNANWNSSDVGNLQTIATGTSVSNTLSSKVDPSVLLNLIKSSSVPDLSPSENVLKSSKMAGSKKVQDATKDTATSKSSSKTSTKILSTSRSLDDKESNSSPARSSDIQSKNQQPSELLHHLMTNKLADKTKLACSDSTVPTSDVVSISPSKSSEVLSKGKRQPSFEFFSTQPKRHKKDRISFERGSSSKSISVGSKESAAAPTVDPFSMEFETSSDPTSKNSLRTQSIDTASKKSSKSSSEATSKNSAKLPSNEGSNKGSSKTPGELTSKNSSKTPSSELTSKNSSKLPSSEDANKNSSKLSSNDVANKSSSKLSSNDVANKSSSKLSSNDVANKSSSKLSSNDVANKNSSKQSSNDVANKSSSKLSSNDAANKSSSKLSSNDVANKSSSKLSSNEVSNMILSYPPPPSCDIDTESSSKSEKTNNGSTSRQTSKRKQRKSRSHPESASSFLASGESVSSTARRGSTSPPVLEKSDFTYMEQFSDISDSDNDENEDPPLLEVSGVCDQSAGASQGQSQGFPLAPVSLDKHILFASMTSTAVLRESRVPVLSKTDDDELMPLEDQKSTSIPAPVHANSSSGLTSKKDPNKDSNKSKIAKVDSKKTKTKSQKEGKQDSKKAKKLIEKEAKTKKSDLTLTSKVEDVYDWSANDDDDDKDHFGMEDFGKRRPCLSGRANGKPDVVTDLKSSKARALNVSTADKSATWNVGKKLNPVPSCCKSFSVIIQKLEDGKNTSKVKMDPTIVHDPVCPVGNKLKPAEKKEGRRKSKKKSKKASKKEVSNYAEELAQSLKSEASHSSSIAEIDKKELVKPCNIGKLRIKLAPSVPDVVNKAESKEEESGSAEPKPLIASRFPRELALKVDSPDPISIVHPEQDNSPSSEPANGLPSLRVKFKLKKVGRHQWISVSDKNVSGTNEMETEIQASEGNERQDKKDEVKLETDPVELAKSKKKRKRREKKLAAAAASIEDAVSTAEPPKPLLYLPSYIVSGIVSANLDIQEAFGDDDGPMLLSEFQEHRRFDAVSQVDYPPTSLDMCIDSKLLDDPESDACQMVPLSPRSTFHVPSELQLLLERLTISETISSPDAVITHHNSASQTFLPTTTSNEIRTISESVNNFTSTEQNVVFNDIDTVDQLLCPSTDDQECNLWTDTIIDNDISEVCVSWLKPTWNDPGIFSNESDDPWDIFGVPSIYSI